MLHLGLALAALAAAYLVSEYAASLRARSLEYSEMLRLLTHIRSRLSSEAEPLPRIVRSFQSRSLEASGLLSALASENAFFRDSLSVSGFKMDEQDKRRIIAYFESFGKSYIGEERVRLGEVIAHFEARCGAVGGECERRIKSAWILTAAAFASAVILII